VVPVVTDPKKVILALRGVVNEMEKSDQILRQGGVRNIASFNGGQTKKLCRRNPERRSPSGKKVKPGREGFAVEVDEQIVVPRGMTRHPEKFLTSWLSWTIGGPAAGGAGGCGNGHRPITQMGERGGIIASWRKTDQRGRHHRRDKAKHPGAHPFQVAAKVDSRTISPPHTPDAIGRGIKLAREAIGYLPQGSAKLIIFAGAGALITDQEIQSIVDFIAKQGKPNTT